MKCSNCSQEGHTKRTCTQPSNASKATKAIKVNAVNAVKEPANQIVKPPLKWVGGKTQIIGQVLALFPKTMKNYVEPFLGGGSVLLALLSSRDNIQVETVKASDTNPNTIGLYQNIQSRIEELLEELTVLMATYSAIEGTTVNRNATEEEATSSRESYYYWVRSTFNALPQAEKIKPKGSAYLLFLNKTCFRGLYREGPHGLNVPFEKQHQHPTVFEEAHLRQVSALIQGVIFTCQPFEDALSTVEAGDFVYLDPPYAPETATSFVGYNADGFSGKAHELLFNTCHALSEKKVKLLMSNADVPLVKDAFTEPRYETQTIEVRRAIHSKKPGAKTNEVLITNRIE